MHHRHHTDQPFSPPSMKRMDSGPGLELSQVPSTLSNDSGTHEHVPQRESHQDDVSISTTGSYEYVSSNDLNMLQAAALLTADCLGTGLLALPQDIKALGKVIGFAFLILNLPINWYAGSILAGAAQFIEEELNDGDKEEETTTTIGRDGLVRVSKGRKAYSSIASSESENATSSESDTSKLDNETATKHDPVTSTTLPKGNHDHHPHHDSSTFDYIGLTSELFPWNKHAFRSVLLFYYTNIFLVLGDYILVMSHAVAAMVGEGRICLPMAGIVASTLMFALSQIKTMANLGRGASIVSLICLAIVVVQCLLAHNTAQSQITTSDYVPPPESVTLLRQLSAIASIGFAVGSQKLFLNIRHEMKVRQESPKSLGVALSVFGTVYVAICLLAGPHPPSFLFDAIPGGTTNRRVAGLLLWIHVAVSFAINSQAICSSMDRLYAHKWTWCDLQHHPQWRWSILTMGMTVSSYFVANAVPFFADLVGLIGALTSVPLTLTLPALFHRKVVGVPLWQPTRYTLTSYALLVFSLAFLILGLTGALGSIEMDWSKQGRPFSCS